MAERDPRAGLPVTADELIDVAALKHDYHDLHPDPSVEKQQVAFGTSGHRGTASARTFNEDHVVAVADAICRQRREAGVAGPLFLGKDTHALSDEAFVTVVEVLAGHGIEVRIQEGFGYTPTPVVSHAICCWNADHSGTERADGVVITPSHNPPEDGGIKYNPPAGGPAEPEITSRIADWANATLESGVGRVPRRPFKQALQAPSVRQYDYIRPYVDDLRHVLDMEAIAGAGLRLGVDALGGAGAAFWEPIAATYDLNIDVLHATPDPTFSFMTHDSDGKIRMDCSSPDAMAGLIALRDRYDIAFGNDPDYDRHGIVTPGAGLMNPNHYLAVAVDYLFGHRNWPAANVGKTLVSSTMIDRATKALGRTVYEVPVGFKWFVEGLAAGTLGFGGEESAGASFLRRDGRVWTTDKDGIILDLLAAEILAVTGRDPGDHYLALTERFGAMYYARTDVPATPEQRDALKQLSPDAVKAKDLAGAPILKVRGRAPGNDELIGGIKVETGKGWFAARPSGTEPLYKVYAESFDSPQHLQQLQAEARTVIAAAFHAAGVTD